MDDGLKMKGCCMATEIAQLPLYSNGISNSKMLHTASGRFYTGMTREEARQLGSEKNTFRRDFNNIDKNKDNVLTNDEILLERELEANRLKIDTVLCTLFALDDIFWAFKGNKSMRLFHSLFAALFAGVAISSVSQKKRMDATNDRLLQELSQPANPIVNNFEFNKLKKG